MATARPASRGKRLAQAAIVAAVCVALAAILGACSSYHRAPVAVPVNPTADQGYTWASGCEDDGGMRVDDALCDTPHAHFYPVWGSVYSDGGLMGVPYGARYPGIWTRARPAGVTVTNTITHVSRSGGIVTRSGTGSGITTASRVGSSPVVAKPVPASTGGRAAGSGIVTAKAPNAPPPSTSPTITRGGLGVPSAKKTK